MVALNPAKYLSNNTIIEVPSGGGLMRTARLMEGVAGPIPCEVYPNRYSLMYRDLYGIQEAHTVIRGTIRYQVHDHPPTVYVLP